MEKSSKRSERPRTRSVDFQNIEGESEARLTVYEKDVLNRIRSTSDSPLERMMAEDDASEEQKQAIQALRRLRRYVKYARLTLKQRRAYELFFITKRRSMTLRKLAKKLKISPSSAWARINGAVLRLERVKERQEEGWNLRKALNGILYAGKLKKVFYRYFDKGWPPQAIAKSLHSNLSTIYSNIQTIRFLGEVYSRPKAPPQNRHQEKSAHL
jgi:hypothetical protein